MLTRREFTGFVSCAICAITSEFVASEASAQTEPPATTTGVTRKILAQTDGPMPGSVTLLVKSDDRAGSRGRPAHASGNRIRSQRAAIVIGFGYPERPAGNRDRGECLGWAS